MRIHQNTDTLPTFKNAIVTIGSFDGVHIGHQKILRRINDLAVEYDGESVVVTFDPHPRSIIYPKANDLRLLSSIEERIKLFEKYGIDHLVIVPFTIEFSQQMPQEYIEKFLLRSFNPRFIVIGYDHRFGLNREGNMDFLKEYEVKNKLEILEIPKFELEEIAVSSSKIRSSLVDGDVLKANTYLGHPYSLSGKVISGKQIGKTIQFPTANIKVHDKFKLLPSDGVYAVRAYLNDLGFNGMMYVGSKAESTFKDIEVNIFDFNDNIYGEEIKVELIEFIRENEKFENIELLKEQLILDRTRCRDILTLHIQNQTIDENINIAILNYNGVDFLESNLPSVLKSSTEKINITVIDNGSQDDSISYLKEWHPEVKLILLSKNLGFAQGYNEGLKQIKSKYLVLLNSDVEVSQNWLDPIIRLMDSDPNIACCQPKIKSLENRNFFEYAGAAGGMIDYMGYPFCKGRIFDSVEEDLGQFEEQDEIFWASGAALVIRRSAFNEVNGFDGDYFAHQEEIDLCWRLKRLGYKCMYVPSSTVYHLGGGTLNYGNSRKVYLNFRNNLTTILKNERSKKLFWLFPLRLILDGIAGLKFLFSGNVSSTIAVIRAHFNVYKNFNSILIKRRRFKDLRKEKKLISNAQSGMIKKSLLWNYYFKRSKTYNSLDLD